MATMFGSYSTDRPNRKGSFFDVDAELKNHAWHPHVNTIEAESILSDKPPYTYLTRPREGQRGFEISFVNLNGQIEHHYFTLIDPILGIWRNSMPDHVGKLGKVICDMMACGVLDCRPL